MDCSVDIVSEAKAGTSDKHWDGNRNWQWYALFEIPGLDMAFSLARSEQFS